MFLLYQCRCCTSVVAVQCCRCVIAVVLSLYQCCRCTSVVAVQCCRCIIAVVSSLYQCCRCTSVVAVPVLSLSSVVAASSPLCRRCTSVVAVPVLSLHHRRRVVAGREAGGVDGDDPERHPQGVHGAEHLHLPAGSLDEDHRRHLLLHVTRELLAASSP